MEFPFQDADPAHRNFQYLEDLSTAYWYSEVLFAALELNLFEFLEKGCSGLNTLARTASCRVGGGGQSLKNTITRFAK